MKMEMLIEELQEVVDNAYTLPLTGGRTVVRDVDRLRDIISEMKANIPQEIRQAKNIVADRAKILSDAKKESERIIQEAEAKSRELIDRHEITRNAQQSADEILSKANEEAEKMRNAASSYIENIMKKADDELSEQLATLKKARQSFMTLQNKNQQKRTSKK